MNKQIIKLAIKLADLHDMARGYHLPNESADNCIYKAEKGLYTEQEQKKQIAHLTEKIEGYEVA